jgi:hypothetical protein
MVEVGKRPHGAGEGSHTAQKARTRAAFEQASFHRMRRENHLQHWQRGVTSPKPCPFGSRLRFLPELFLLPARTNAQLEGERDEQLLPS